MAMHSTELLPQLQSLPADEPRQRMSFRDAITGLVSTDRAMFAAEFASAASFGMWAVFPGVNVDDNLARAYEARWPNLANKRDLHDQVEVLLESDEVIATNGWFLSGLKGQLAEFEAKEMLEAKGFTNVELAPLSNQPEWDISAIHPDGQIVLVQVKTGTSLSAAGVEDLMEESPDLFFVLGEEIHKKVIASGMDTGDRIIDSIGPDLELVEGTTDGLDTLSANMGIDIPDGVVDIIPFAAVIVGSVRLIYSVLQTEREFKAADRTTKNQIQVVQTLTLMSKMGVSTVLATVGGMAGAASGTAVPGIGNVAGGIGGTVVGAGMGMYLNTYLQPHMLDLALDITGLTRDDLFYYKNKPRIDALAITFQTKAGELAVASGL